MLLCSSARFTTRLSLSSLMGRQQRRTFSSSPKWSARNRRDLGILSVGFLVATTATVYWNLYTLDWEEEIQLALANLQELTVTSGDHAQSSHATPLYLPHPVQRHLNKIKEISGASENQRINLSQSKLRPYYQKGSFHASNQWFPFTATLWISPVGLVWSADTIIWNMPHSILETFSLPLSSSSTSMSPSNDRHGPWDSRQYGTDGMVLTRAWGKYPLIQVQEDEPLAWFWLALMAFCNPQHLFMASTASPLRWKELSQDSNEAQAIFLNDYHVTFLFDSDTGLLKNIQIAQDDSTVWQAHFQYSASSNDEQACMPSYMELGKRKGVLHQSHFQIHRLSSADSTTTQQ